MKVEKKKKHTQLTVLAKSIYAFAFYIEAP